MNDEVLAAQNRKEVRYFSMFLSGKGVISKQENKAKALYLIETYSVSH